MHNLKEAIFAGGCFWCMQPPFDQTPGVISTIPGYIGGRSSNPTYEEVCTGSSGHIEAIAISYDPSIVSYETLLHVFWRNIDPFDKEGQFADQGYQYQPVIFYENTEEQQIAEQSKKALALQFNKPIAVSIQKQSKFYPAETYHLDYYKTHPTHYKMYRIGSGREKGLQAIWGNIPKIDNS